MQKLEQQLAVLAERVAQHESLVSSVSAVSVGWHIDHLCLVMKGIGSALKASDPKNYKWRFSLPRLVVMTSGKIPRGRGKAPRQSLLEPDVSAELLHLHLQKATEAIAEIRELDPNKYFEHPYFGHLKRNATLRFLEIHNAHHLAIIDDIIKGLR